ncbi:hypothetical protein J5N97_028455 [Dioscorea zingiberensis]|uniref:RNase H type-1 domain-containing protein n=1 Tax=Dioscorea zingiberensis TaxID=325984 RepID=A0A9D5H4U5_9LILI|nr:hypothetical protein J5N97_028455 [Dioscorea zingiberensis]
MTRPLLTGRLAKWALILMEFDITYTPQKAIKGQALADFLAAHPLPDNSPLNYDLSDEETLTVEEARWRLYFDGASSIKPTLMSTIPQIKAGIGLVFVTPERGILRYALSLTEPCTNNEAEYDALIAGLELAIKMGIQHIHIFGDSQLIIKQVEGDYKIYKPELLKYHKKVKGLMKKIPQVQLKRVLRSENGEADSLAKVAKELANPDYEEIHITIRNRRPISTILDDDEEESAEGKAEVFTFEMPEEDWRQPFIEYLKYNKLPEDKSKGLQIK